MPINNIAQTISTIPPAGARGVDVQTIFVTKQEDFQDHLQGITVDELNTFKDQLNSRIGEINSTTTTMNGYASTASTGASTATTKAGEASTSAGEALTYRNQAETFKNNASASATKASQWADNNYNVAVETGKYSAKHWSTVAQNATEGKVDKVPSTDNAVVRFNGTTGEVQNSGVIIDDDNIIYTQGSQFNVYGFNADTSSFEFVQRSTGKGFTWYVDGGLKKGLILDGDGNLLLTSGTGALGYGVGAGGTVTQLTSKSTAVTLNKPCGLVTMHNAALAAGSTVMFIINNSLFNVYNDVCLITPFYSLADPYNYRIECIGNGGGASIRVTVTNISGNSLSEMLQFRFVIIKGAIS